MNQDILTATSAFENWLSLQLPIVKQDLALKHQSMAEDAFPFFRATFYRWLQLWPAICPDLAKAPRLLAVGDLHIENFGTWRDLEGRLIWGVNDLDEVFPCSYAIDLVRLTASAYLAILAEHLDLSRREASEAIEEGYRDALAAGGKPFILAEDHQWLRLMALSKLRDPVHFWDKLTHLPPYTAKPPQEVRDLLEESLPPKSRYQLKRRIAGLGSLGHPRILAVSCDSGAFLAREAKAIRPSAWVWAMQNGARVRSLRGMQGSNKGSDQTPRKDSAAGTRGPSSAASQTSHQQVLYGPQLAASAKRVQDPFVRFHSRWLVRRLAPDCSRIELASLAAERDEARLLYSMGWETANMHFGSPAAIPLIKRDLAQRKSRWLHKAAKAMSKATLQDWHSWRKSWKKFARRTPCGPQSCHSCLP